VDEPVEIDKNQRHTLEVVTDRLTVKAENRSRIADAVEQAFHLAEGSWQSRPRRVRSILASRWLAPYVVGLYLSFHLVVFFQLTLWSLRSM